MRFSLWILVVIVNTYCSKIAFKNWEWLISKIIRELILFLYKWVSNGSQRAFELVLMVKEYTVLIVEKIRSQFCVGLTKGKLS